MAVATDSKKLSSGSLETWGFHGAILISTARKQRALSAKTVLAPTKSKSSPPRAGPTIAEMFSCSPLKVEAEGSSSLDTISGTTAEKTGALNANPVPIRNVEPRMTYGVRRFSQPRIASPPAHTARQMYPTYNSCDPSCQQELLLAE